MNSVTRGTLASSNQAIERFGEMFLANLPRLYFHWGSAEVPKSAKLVRIGMRLVPDRITVEHPGSDGLPSLRMDLRVIDGVTQCRSVRISSVKGGVAVRKMDLAAVKVNRWVADTFAAFAFDVSVGPLEKNFGTLTKSPGDIQAALDFESGQRGQGPRGRTPERVERAAKAYRDNIHLNPRQAAADELDVAVSTVDAYLKDARNKGLLSKTSPGKKKK